MNRQFFSFILTATLFAAMFTSCDRAVLTGEDPTGPIAVNLHAGIKPASTYAVNDQWETTDKVGLFMKRTGQALTDFGVAYSDAANVYMSIDGQKLTSNPPVMYPTGGNVDFVAYYPYYPISVYLYNPAIPVNVAEQELGLPVEILYSSNITNQMPTESPVTLEFNYSLAKIELTVTGGAGSNLTEADFSAATVTIENLYTQADFRLANGTFTDYQEKQPVTLHKKSSNATSATFEALVLPTNEEVTFLFDVGGAVYRHKMTVSHASETLYKYSFELDFPVISDRTATLLNAVIIPRGEEVIPDISVDASKQMTMTTDTSKVWLGIGGIGKITIDWGDGTPGETYTLLGGNYSYRYSYSSTSAHTITITGENVTYLYCSNNQLSNLDVSKNTVLKELSCLQNQLTSLDVSNNTALTRLYCVVNQLTSLDVSNNTALTWLTCSSNQLTNLDVSNNTALRGLDCYSNQLTSLDVSNNTALRGLDCSSNQLTNLDVSKNTALTELDCSSNQLTNLDVSNNTTLYFFGCQYNQLKEADLNALFVTLHNNIISERTKNISIGDNPGTDTCDRSIAENKGWIVANQ